MWFGIRMFVLWIVYTEDKLLIKPMGTQKNVRLWTQQPASQPANSSKPM